MTNGVCDRCGNDEGKYLSNYHHLCVQCAKLLQIPIHEYTMPCKYNGCLLYALTNWWFCMLHARYLYCAANHTHDSFNCVATFFIASGENDNASRLPRNICFNKKISQRYNVYGPAVTHILSSGKKIIVCKYHTKDIYNYNVCYIFKYKRDGLFKLCNEYNYIDDYSILMFYSKQILSARHLLDSNLYFHIIPRDILMLINRFIISE